MKPAELLQKPSVLIAGSVVAACGLAFVTAVTGSSILEGAVQAATMVDPRGGAQ